MDDLRLKHAELVNDELLRRVSGVILLLQAILVCAANIHDSGVCLEMAEDYNTSTRC